MNEVGTILRLVISHTFAVYFLLRLIPINEPRKRNEIIIILASVIITFINALLIIDLGLTFYIKFYLLTLTTPYALLFYYFAVYKGSKVIFALLSAQVINNIAIINGLYASYIFYGENNPTVDTVARIITYIIILPIVIKFFCPMYLKMAQRLNKGWLMLNFSLVLSYALAYYILFIPNDIFTRPEYFTHAYIGVILALLIYVIIYYLFVEIQMKMDIEQDKQILSTKVRSLTAESAEMTSIAYHDVLTGVSNRYSLFKRMNQLIESNHSFLVVFIDLDNLKKINDTYGHSMGDAYLKQFAVALHDVMDTQGDVYRFAGDEFVCLIENDIAHFKHIELRNRVDKTFILMFLLKG
jgi:GGDEF domain-containing protein